MPIRKIDQVDTMFADKMVQLIDYVVDDVYEVLKQNIVDKAYNENENTDYFNGNGRTGEFLESFQRDETKQELRTVIGRVFQDINFMRLASPNEGNMWTSHKSMLGQDVRSWLGDILNSTNTGMWVTGSRKGHFWDDTINYIDTNLDRIVLESARKIGIPIKKG